MTRRYLCIHGHFYQPPRENPWLEAVEPEESAWPYHDWNERITDECYASNATSRVLDDQQRIVEIRNNYAQMSFNFGPTLLSWMKQKSPLTYDTILQADRANGSAMAQGYNHIILPLANRRDKETQVRWGLRDFRERFQRDAEGMWLPEAAVDTETLEILAGEGVRFTVLSPDQALKVRAPGGAWTDPVDTRRPYLVRLPSGKSISVFFYDGGLSRAVAFEKLLSNGGTFADRLTSAFDSRRREPQLVNIATDGETYGHHHRFGDMALAFALRQIESRKDVTLVNYARYLDLHPPTHEAKIVERSSWSCAHGVERWRADCGCTTHSRADWNQKWREPLRAAMDELRDGLGALFEKQSDGVFKDPWKTRDEYIRVILDRSPENVDRFLSEHAPKLSGAADRILALRLLEMQRNALLMYTSCGWFFSDISGLETVQVMRYAGRALHLAEELGATGLEARFMHTLESAASNIEAHRSGRQVYERFVRSARVDLLQVGAHYALSSLFEDYEDTSRVYVFDVECRQSQVSRSGKARSAVGSGNVKSRITGESKEITFCVLHTGDHNLSGGVRESRGGPFYEALVKESTSAFQNADFAEMYRLLGRHFGPNTYSLRSLFREEQRKIAGLILKQTLSDASAVYRKIYESHAPLMRFLSSIQMPLPKALRSAGEFHMQQTLLDELGRDRPNPDTLHSLLRESETDQIRLEEVELRFALQNTLERLCREFRGDPANTDRLRELDSLSQLTRFSVLHIDRGRVQNEFYRWMKEIAPAHRQDRDWMEAFLKLGESLAVSVDSLRREAPTESQPRRR